MYLDVEHSTNPRNAKGWLSPIQHEGMVPPLDDVAPDVEGMQPQDPVEEAITVELGL